MKSSVADRLQHILDAIDRIDRIIAGKTLQQFNEDLTMRPATERYLEIVSEASRHIPEDYKSRTPQIQWRRLADLGNILRHIYDQVDPKTVWIILQNDLAPVRQAVKQFLLDEQRD